MQKGTSKKYKKRYPNVIVSVLLSTGGSPVSQKKIYLNKKVNAIAFNIVHLQKQFDIVFL